ncbi:MAG: AAA family ATPase [Spirochaetes bacterium]|nr:AAA family ATPase [Spirochaetota bacterium]
MIINTIELNNWRKINQLKLDFAEGINVLYGKNEIGKSTIIEAVRFAFFEKSESDRMEVKKTISWNTKVKSNVKLKFTAKDNNVYLIDKTFPKGNAELYLIKKQIKKKISEGKNVNEDILKILGINDKAINLFDLLWISQGKSLSIFDKNSELENKEFQTEIKSIIKSSIISKKTEDFYKMICDNYENYYSSKTNKFRIDITRLNELCNEKTNLLNSINSQINTVSEKTDQIHEIHDKIEKTETENKKLKEQLEKYEILKNEIEKYEKQKIKYDFFKKDYEKLIIIKEENNSLEKQIPDLLKTLKAYLVHQKELINKKIAEYYELKKQEAETESKINNLKVKDTKIIDEIISLKNKIEIINNQLNLNKLKVEIEPYKKINYKIKLDSNDSNISTEEKKEFFSNDRISVEIKDTACIKICAPVSKDKINELSKTVETSNKKLNELYKTTQTEDIAVIKKEHEKFINHSSKKEIIKMKLSGFDIKKLSDSINFLQKEIDIINYDSADIIINKKEDLQIKIQNLKNEIIKKQNKISNNKEQFDDIIKQSTFDEYRLNYFKLKDEIELQEKRINCDEIKINSDISSLINSARKKQENNIETLINLKSLKSELEVKSNLSNGLLKNKADIENELENLNEKRKNELTNFYSYKLLKDLIETEKKDLDDKIIEPLQEKISEEFKKLTGSNYETINITKDLILNSADANTINGKITEINLEDISLGTKEQLSFIFRFIIAQYLSANDRSVMIMDDSFVNTDMIRFQYLLEKIESYENKIQFLIFTCRENDFKNILKNVNYINLEKLII